MYRYPCIYIYLHASLFAVKQSYTHIYMLYIIYAYTCVYLYLQLNYKQNWLLEVGKQVNPLAVKLEN